VKLRSPLACALLLVSNVSVAAPSAASSLFRPDDAAPYFSTGPAAAAAARLRLEEWTEAAKGFAAYVTQHPHAKDLPQAGFLRAYAELKSGQLNPAAQHFDALATEYPLLADYHRLLGARAHLQSGRAKEALARAKQIPTESVLDGEARLMRGDALRTLGQPAAAAEEYRGYLAAYATSWRAAEVRFHLGEMLLASGKKDDAEAELRRVYLEAPEESWGRLAGAKLSQKSFGAAELAKRAMVLFDNMRNQESEKEWSDVLTAPQLTDELGCVARYHLAQSVFKARDRMRAAPLFDLAVDACGKAKNEDLLTKAMYQGARSWGTKGDKDLPSLQKAIGLYERIWKEHPTHSFADDARLREAEDYETLKNDAKVDELYSGLPDAFPAGDQKGEALWRMAFRAWKKADLDGAKKWLELEHKLLPREDGWWEAGRTLYWLGRVEDKAGHADEAVARWSEAVREYPLSYYALQALGRLRERDDKKAQALVDEMVGSEAPVPWKFTPRPLFATSAFKRGLELARLGLGAEAKRELSAIGLHPVIKKGEPVADEELLWLAAVLYDRAGEFALSHAIPRHLMTEWARAWPSADNRRRWLLAYPRGYADLIEKHAPLNGQPTALEFAIVREESAFDPLMESFANAIGLTQLTAAPAERFAQGLPHDRAALRDPAINVTIGARELGHCWSAEGHPALAIAAYNAGEGAVNRWRRDPERTGLAADEFIEAIPYDETRGYTKRVLSSYFAYTWLSAKSSKLDDRVPPLPLTFSKKN
jgi:soluble lytic murein transglycosylase